MEELSNIDSAGFAIEVLNHCLFISYLAVVVSLISLTNVVSFHISILAWIGKTMLR